MVTAQVPQKRVFLGSVELYLGDVLAGTGHLVVTQKRETKQLLLQSPRNELFKFVELYLRYGLKMAENSKCYTWGDCTVTVDSYYGLEIYILCAT